MLVHIDPTKAYPKAKQGALVGACGLIPLFFIESSMILPEDASAKDFYDSMVSLYGFGDFSSVNWGTVDAEGHYVSSYEEDPDLSPYVSLETLGGVSLYVYPNAILAVRKGDETIISRMD